MDKKLPFEDRKPNLIVKREAETSEKFGRNPEDIPTEELVQYGVVNIDKPKGPTSHQVSAYVRQIMELSKTGHSGTLDPKVTGVLPVALGRATKIAHFLLTAGKEYLGVMHLHKEVSEEKLREVCEGFIGNIKQLPPIKSAVKRQERMRKIYYLDLLEISGQDVLFRTGCEAGTYIRKLVHDIGVKLKTGAHMSELRRTKAGPFAEQGSVTLQDLQDAYHYWKNENDDSALRKIILPVESAVSHLPKIWVMDTTVDSICHGADLKIPGISIFDSSIKAEDYVAVMTLKEELVCVGKSRMVSSEILRAKRGTAIRTEKVFMQPGIYPKIQK